MKTTNHPGVHKVCLTWSGGGREIVSLTPVTTLQDLGEMASQLVGHAVDLTVMGLSRPQPLTPSADTLARSVIPHMTRVHCSQSKKRLPPQESGETTKDAAMTAAAAAAAAVVSKKRKQNPTNDEVNNAIDLTVDSNDDNKNENTDGDEALARRLQQQENEAAARFAPVEDDWVDRSVQQNQVNDPTMVENAFWIYKHGPAPYNRESVLGKWLVHCSAAKIHQAWQTIGPAVVSGELHAAQAKVSTQAKNKSYVICVYTSKQRIDEVGYKLVHLVKHNISYKTDEATEQQIYSHNSKNIALKTLYWNHGRPTGTKPPPKMTARKSLELATRAAQKKQDQLVVPDVPLTCVGMARYMSRTEQQELIQEGVTRVVLVREASNAHDRNAIRVDLVDSNKKIGYITAQQAAVVAPWLDRDLVRVDTATMLLRVGDSTMELSVQVRACHDAKSMLASL